MKIPKPVEKFKLTTRTREKYKLYERAVQSPDHHIAWFVQIYQELRGKYAKALREDFCGTFRLSAEWVQRNRANSAIGLDLDPEPLAYGTEITLPVLNESQKKRLSILQQNVISETKPKSDLAIACNFSFCIFRERKLMLKYFRSVRKSLKNDGLFLLDLAGGPGMIEKLKERKALREKGKTIGTYVWDQKSFDPITREGHYGIHFRLPDGRQLNDTFTYHWRLWTIPELREILDDAGFEETHVYWETEHQGEGTGEYVRSETGDNAYAWVAYIVAGVRKSATLKPSRGGAKQKAKASSKVSRRLNSPNQGTSRR